MYWYVKISREQGRNMGDVFKREAWVQLCRKDKTSLRKK